MNDIASHRLNGSGAEIAPALTAVICTYNRYDVLGDAIASLESQGVDPDRLEILIVDNSTDTQSQAAYWNQNVVPANARLIIDPVPGLSRARNTALRQARGDIIAYIDDDAIALPGWAGALIDIFARHETAGSAGGPVEPIWPATQPAWLHKLHRGYFTIVDLGETARALAQGEWLAGTNIAFRKPVLEKTGGFNEGLGRIRNSLMSNEELAVSAQVAELGYQSWYTPEARVMHRVHDDRVSQHWLRRRVSWQAVSDLLADPKKFDADTCWNRLAAYLSGLPVEMRGVRGLFLDTPDPDTFYDQTLALEAFLFLALNQGRDPERE
ncbi:MAG: glycosyltransferase family 2 protein [Rhizomicrobium sp.]|jgi:glycosyltransferase involved in cell wall biosynthesis